ncbi:MAG: OmpA family protein [Akkermansiaceae bacterium]|nr:OmpA family protein [Luteolibacter sp.]
MEQEFRWSDARDAESYRLPGPDHLGRWAAVAMVVSLLLHVVLFFSLDRVKIAFGFMKSEDLTTAPIDIRRVEIKPFEESPPPTENVITPPNDSAALLDEVDLLELLPKDVEIDIATTVIDPEYALKMSNPLASGEVAETVNEISSKFDLEANLPELGRMTTELKPAAVGQIIVDPGSVKVDHGEMANFTDELIKKGNNGLVDRGKLDGVESLDNLLDLPSNLLLNKKTLLPSDLLFEFNRAELRESAKVGLMKLGLLIDKNPTLYCWIEGHTDLIGSDEMNFKLSERRAEAVKNYLVKSMRMDPERIFTRGLGKTQPLITSGNADIQAPNRRVEIRMRKSPPPTGGIKTPKAEPVIIEPEPPKAVLVKPNLKAIPVEEPEPPRAEPVPPRAKPIEEEIPVEAPRAVPIEP